MKPQRSGIYKITNKLNRKVYIGQSVDISARWAKHRSCSQEKNPTIRLYQAMQEDGFDNFSFEIIELCPKEELNEKEWYYIQQYNALDENFGYNMSTKLNLQKKITKEQAEEAQYLLLESTLKNKEIAEIFDVSHTWVSLVNQGKLWYNENLTYPLRPVISNLKKGYYCCDCGIEVTKGAKRCPSCAHKAAQTCERPSREDLKKMIRTMPFIEIGRKFNVAGNSIKKWCDRYNLPRLKREINSYSDEEWELI